MASENKLQDSCTDFIFPRSFIFFPSIFLLWELFLIKNCCKLTIRRRPRRKKKIFQLSFNGDSYQLKINADFNFSLLSVNYDVGFKRHAFFQHLAFCLGFRKKLT